LNIHPQLVGGWDQELQANHEYKCPLQRQSAMMSYVNPKKESIHPQLGLSHTHKGVNKTNVVENSKWIDQHLEKTMELWKEVKPLQRLPTSVEHTS
jgi:hypothetical protein